MTKYERCLACGRDVYPSGNVHLECKSLAEWGDLSYEDARRETAKAELLMIRLAPKMRSAANQTAILTVAYFAALALLLVVVRFLVQAMI